MTRTQNWYNHPMATRGATTRAGRLFVGGPAAYLFLLPGQEAAASKGHRGASLRMLMVILTATARKSLASVLTAAHYTYTHIYMYTDSNRP